MPRNCWTASKNWNHARCMVSERTGASILQSQGTEFCWSPERNAAWPTPLFQFSETLSRSSSTTGPRLWPPETSEWVSGQPFAQFPFCKVNTWKSRITGQPFPVILNSVRIPKSECWKSRGGFLKETISSLSTLAWMFNSPLIFKLLVFPRRQTETRVQQGSKRLVGLAQKYLIYRYLFLLEV